MRDSATIWPAKGSIPPSRPERAITVTSVPNPAYAVAISVPLNLLFGVAAAVGVAYAAWQTLRADDELWVADDPLRAPDA